MNQHARVAEGAASQDGATLIPTAREVVVRALPASALTIIGIPVLAWWLMDPAGETRTRWWQLLFIALLGLAVLVHHFVQAPRPRFDKRISTREVKGALSYTRRFGTVPTDPRVRTAAGVFACSDVETIMLAGAFLLGGVLTALIRPELPWLDAGFVPTAIPLVFAFKARHGWPYLKALHFDPRVG